MLPAITAPTLRADDRKTYHDKLHNDDHEWNSHEDKAYRIWAKENHRKYQDFAKLPCFEQTRIGNSLIFTTIPFSGNALEPTLFIEGNLYV